MNGTGKLLDDLPFFVSGKTGTSVKNYGTNLDREYQASFVGFFPSNKPKYSCIVLIDTPNKEKGFYGSQVAIPAFKEIAKNIYIQEGLRWNNTDLDNPMKLNSFVSEFSSNYDTLKNSISKNYYPSVVGMHLRDAIFLLEKIGYKVIIEGGLGNVKKQYPKANTQIKKDLAITLFT